MILTLGRNGVEGCGEFYQKATFDGSTEYIVACTTDFKKTWTVWQVWTSAEKVMRLKLSTLQELGGPP